MNVNSGKIGYYTSGLKDTLIPQNSVWLRTNVINIIDRGLNGNAIDINNTVFISKTNNAARFKKEIDTDSISLSTSDNSSLTYKSDHLNKVNVNEIRFLFNREGSLDRITLFQKNKWFNYENVSYGSVSEIFNNRTTNLKKGEIHLFFSGDGDRDRVLKKSNKPYSLYISSVNRNDILKFPNEFDIMFDNLMACNCL